MISKGGAKTPPFFFVDATMPKRVSIPEPLFLLLIGFIALVISGIMPKDRTTWWLEVMPIFLVVPVLIAVFKQFAFTPLVYRLIFFHALVLMIGGHYTYAETPLGYWFSDLFGFSRNHFDRFGHILQGAVPALVFREFLLRRSPLKPGKMLFFLVVCVCMAISAWYELLEWLSAVLLGQGADAFLGTQGDPWDTQTDMFMCFLGSMASQLIFSRWHDKQLKKKAWLN